MNTFKQAVRRSLGTALVATTIGLGTVATAASPAEAATRQQCAAAARYGSYAHHRAAQSGSTSESQFWMLEYLNNDEWMADNC